MHRMWLTFVQCMMPKTPSTRPLFCVYVNHFPARIPEHIWFLNPHTYILSTKPQAMSSPGKREQQFVIPTVPIPRTVGAPVGFSSLLHNIEHFLRNMHMFMPCCVLVLVVFIHNIQITSLTLGQLIVAEPLEQPWMILVNTPCESTTKHGTVQPCAYAIKQTMKATLTLTLTLVLKFLSSLLSETTFDQYDEFSPMNITM